MKNLAIVSALMLVLVVGIAIPSMAFADNKCVPEDGKSCVFNLKNGDVKVKDLTIGPFNIGSSGPAVDQEARDEIVSANAKIVELQSQLATANSNVDSLNATVQSVSSDNAALRADVDNLKAIVANLSSSAITDIELGNDNGTNPVPEPIPPVDNSTGTNSTATNSTG